jgi:hypothetical protein
LPWPLILKAPVAIRYTNGLIRNHNIIINWGHILEKSSATEEAREYDRIKKTKIEKFVVKNWRPVVLLSLKL